ncbi:MAG: ornithine carbamoyltransferase [Nitrospinae bacterium]|nr:ornithine carbamoyltransferase [Nitrospinota bacterium]
MPKDFLKLSDHTPEDIRWLVEETLRTKRAGRSEKPLAGKSLGMIFTKSSTRTRIGFEVGMYQLGGYATTLRPDEIQLTRGESLRDTAQVLSRFLDGLVVRTYSQEELEELAAHATIPIINALTDKYHPCQAIADYATMLEVKGTLKGLKVAYIGDGNNVANSLLMGGAMLGVDVALATPKNYAPPQDVLKTAAGFAAQSGARIDLTENPLNAARHANFVYTDVWVSMGQEGEENIRRKEFKGFIIDDALMKEAKPDCKAMHCLPAHRGEEISASVMDGPASIVFDQAENKMHAQKAILKKFLGGK